MPENDWKHWLYGLISAAIGAAANTVTVIIVDPAVFNFQEGIGKLGTVALVSAIVAVAMYLKQSPLPSISAVDAAAVEAAKTVALKAVSDAKKDAKD